MGEIVFGGHSTVLIELEGTRIVADPLLRPRLYGLMRRHHGLSPDEVGSVDAVLISHLHHDHLDLPSLRSLGRSTPIVTPVGGAEFLLRRGYSRVTELAPGEGTPIGALTVRAVEAAHEGGRLFGRGPGGAVGYVVEGGARIYFAGDTERFDRMADLSGVDVALLPIWGWGPTLGPGHMDPDEAARAAAALRPRLVVPIHWGTFLPLWSRGRGGDRLRDPARVFAARMAELAPGVAFRVLAPRESVMLATA